MLLSPVAEAEKILARAGRSVKPSTFRETVLNSIEHALSLLASEGLEYPSVAVTGGAAILLAERRLSDIYSTGDVDLLLEFPTDVDEIFSTLIELERKHPDEIFTIATKGVAELVPLKRKELLPVDFVCPAEPSIRKLFQYTIRNAKTKLASLSIGSKPVTVYVARLEDVILCKLAVGREKDLAGLKPIVLKLEHLGGLDWGYINRLPGKFGLEKRVKLIRRRA